MKKFAEFIAEAGTSSGRVTEKALKGHLKDGGFTPVRHDSSRFSVIASGTPGYSYTKKYGADQRPDRHEIEYTSYSKEESHGALKAISDHLHSVGIHHTMADHGKGYNDYRTGKEKTARRITIPIKKLAD
jgi:hypothetical protein